MQMSKLVWELKETDISKKCCTGANVLTHQGIVLLRPPLGLVRFPKL